MHRPLGSMLHHAAILSINARRRSAIELDFESLEESLERAVLEPVLLAVRTYLIEEAAAEPDRPSPEEARREAEEIWRGLERLPAPRRRRLIELSLHSRSWALAERLCEASVQAAADKPGDALELADLALSIAERVEGEEGCRLKGYV